MFKHLLVLVFLLISVQFASAAPANWASLVKNGGIRVEDSSGKVIVSFQDEQLFIPASTMKLATSFCALEEMGGGFRYTTEFLAQPSEGRAKTLFVRGAGDPWLVSEEIAAIAATLSAKMTRIDRIVVDTSFFDSPITIDGASASTNPYDAKNAAFVGNFSTAFLTRRKDGSIISAEPQTPLTPLSLAAGAKLVKGTTERINLGSDWKTGARYAAELLAAQLRSRGVAGEMSIDLGTVPDTATVVYKHTSSQSLRDLVKGLLQYSTNFTANQLFLTLGAQKYGAPATLEKGQRALNECLTKRVGWRNFHVEEGSGLSRKTAVSAHMMTDLLKLFGKYEELLHVQDGFTAKTGTLTGVNTLAGYFDLPGKRNVRFAILVNSSVDSNYKFTVARIMRQRLQGDFK